MRGWIGEEWVGVGCWIGQEWLDPGGVVGLGRSGRSAWVVGGGVVGLGGGGVEGGEWSVRGLSWG